MRPEIDGNEIQEILGITPGPLVGRAYRFLLDLRLDHGILGKEAAADELRRWAAEEGILSPGGKDPLPSVDGLKSVEGVKPVDGQP